MEKEEAKKEIRKAACELLEAVEHVGYAAEVFFSGLASASRLVSCASERVRRTIGEASS